MDPRFSLDLLHFGPRARSPGRTARRGRYPFENEPNLDHRLALVAENGAIDHGEARHTLPFPHPPTEICEAPGAPAGLPTACLAVVNRTVLRV